MKPQASVWLDMTNDGQVGIECDDKSLTFDGHFVCIFPVGKDEKDSSVAMERAEAVMAYMRGQKQARRY